VPRALGQFEFQTLPLTDRNPQKFVDISKATEANFQEATERVYRGAARASSLVLNNPVDFQFPSKRI
jgi:hypothetical protein